MVLFGHSLGVPFLLDVLERAHSAGEGVFFVSGFAGLPDLELFGSVNRTFVDRNFDWEQIVVSVRRSFVYQGADDPDVPQAWSAYLARKLTADRRVIPGGGHLNSVEAHKQLEVLWSGVQSI